MKFTHVDFVVELQILLLGCLPEFRRSGSHDALIFGVTEDLDYRYDCQTVHEAIKSVLICYLPNYNTSLLVYSSQKLSEDRKEHAHAQPTLR
jgi:hypothetical protein